MILLIAVLIYILGLKIPLWLTGKRIIDVRINGGIKQVFFELSGVIFVFLAAFIMLTVVGLTTKERYLLNDNAIFGLNFSQPAKNVGFKNGDKIVSINDKKVVEFTDIFEDMLYAFNDVKIGIIRDKKDTIIELTNKEVFQLFEGGVTPFIPRLNSDTVFNARNDLTYSERKRSLSKSLSLFPLSVTQFFKLFAPKESIAYGGFPTQRIASLESFIHVLCVSLTFLGFLNLLPIPGLGFGNTCIALIETIRKRKFNTKRVQFVRYVCVGVISLIMISIIIFAKI